MNGLMDGASTIVPRPRRRETATKCDAGDRERRAITEFWERAAHRSMIWVGKVDPARVSATRYSLPSAQDVLGPARSIATTCAEVVLDRNSSRRGAHHASITDTPGDQVSATARWVRTRTNDLDQVLDKNCKHIRLKNARRQFAAATVAEPFPKCHVLTEEFDFPLLTEPGIIRLVS